MAKHRQEYRASEKISQYPRHQEAIDMLVDCAFCKTRLYVPDTSIDAVLASLRVTGSVILVCPACGQAQLASWNMAQSRYVND